MELEFDKEIDVILRKARSGSGVSVKIANAGHLDADTIAAFAENALPDKAKLLYMEHLADCDRCRKILSQAILLNTEADAATASSFSAPIVETTIPWYRSIFRTPNLALTMGALVLAFSGILGYLVIQNRNESSNATVSQVTEQEPTRSGPYFGGDAAAANSISSNSTANSANTAASASNTATGKPAESANTASGPSDRVDSVGDNPAALDDKPALTGGVAAEPAKPVAAAPPPVDRPATERDENRSDAVKLKEDNKDLELAKRKQMEDRGRSRDVPPAAAKTGPSRSGPLQNQSNQVNSNVFDMAVTRLVGGKSFQNRNGAWYDSAYRGQATTNVRRGTDAFTKLDGGLRSIANTLGGTVVVMWKEKAYRIQ